MANPSSSMHKVLSSVPVTRNPIRWDVAQRYSACLACIRSTVQFQYFWLCEYKTETHTKIICFVSSRRGKKKKKGKNCGKRHAWKFKQGIHSWQSIKIYWYAYKGHEWLYIFRFLILGCGEQICTRENVVVCVMPSTCHFKKHICFWRMPGQWNNHSNTKPFSLSLTTRI